MKTHFPGYYRPSDEDLAKLWKNCTFVLDANVLLNLYRYPKTAREDLLRVLKSVSSRLWIPHQVALEFQRNRLTVIAEQVQRFDDVKRILDGSLRNLGSGLASLQLKKRHSTINPDEFLNKVDEVFQEFLSDLEKTQKEQPDVHSEDKLRGRIDSLFSGRVGNPPEKQSELETIYTEGKTRYELRFPPGYEDSIKSKSGDKEPASYIYGGLTYKMEFGDLILWYQIIDQSKKENWKHVIFITDDEKEDWWWIAESRGKKTMGPRPELIEEIAKKAGVTSFYMYNSERFLEFANTYLQAEVEQESIEQVRNIAQYKYNLLDFASKPYLSLNFNQLALFNWINRNFPDDSLHIGFSTKYYSDLDFLRVNKNGETSVGYTIENLDTTKYQAIRINDLSHQIYNTLKALNKVELSSLCMVFISDDEEKLAIYRKEFNAFRKGLPEKFEFLFGKTELEGESLEPIFIPIVDD